VLAFFPGAFTEVCTREMCVFRDSMESMMEFGAQIVGICVNDPFTNNAFADAYKLPFAILSDYTRETVKEYDVFHEDYAGLKGAKVTTGSVWRSGVQMLVIGLMAGFAGFLIGHFLGAPP